MARRLQQRWFSVYSFLAGVITVSVLLQSHVGHCAPSPVNSKSRPVDNSEEFDDDAVVLGREAHTQKSEDAPGALGGHLDSTGTTTPSPEHNGDEERGTSGEVLASAESPPSSGHKSSAGLVPFLPPSPNGPAGHTLNENNSPSHLHSPSLQPGADSSDYSSSEEDEPRRPNAVPPARVFSLFFAPKSSENSTGPPPVIEEVDIVLVPAQPPRIFLLDRIFVLKNITNSTDEETTGMSNRPIPKNSGESQENNSDPEQEPNVTSTQVPSGQESEEAGNRVGAHDAFNGPILHEPEDDNGKGSLERNNPFPRVQLIKTSSSRLAFTTTLSPMENNHSGDVAATTNLPEAPISPADVPPVANETSNDNQVQMSGNRRRREAIFSSVPSAQKDTEKQSSENKSSQETLSHNGKSTLANSSSSDEDSSPSNGTVKIILEIIKVVPIAFDNDEPTTTTLSTPSN